MEQKNKSSITERIIAYTDELPECCASFLLETGTAMAQTTRLEYAKELTAFFSHLISYNPHFCELGMQDVKIDDVKMITSQDISRYLTLYKDNNHKERTTARKRASLSSFFSYLVANRQIDFNPVSAAVKVKVHQSDEVTHLDIKEQISLLDAVESGNYLDLNKQKYHDRYRLRDTALIMLLLDTGMRVSELRGIDIIDIDFDKCSAIVTRKGGNLQTIYFSDEVSGAIYEYVEERRLKYPDLGPNDPLFTTLKGERLSVRAIEKLVKKYALSALPGKGDKITPHKMRSSFAMEYYDSTKDILALQRKLGHKNIAATNIYAKATDKKMQETRSIMSEKRNSR